MKQEKKNYEAPKLTVVQFHVERGYVLSAATLDTENNLFEWGNSDPYVTQYDEDATWTGYSWNN